jgi:tetratricopeptide (TPR) repeat protein
MRFPKAYSYQLIVCVFILCLLLPFFVQGQRSALVTHDDVQGSFNLIFSEPDSAYNVLMDLEGRSKLQPDSLHAIVLNNLGVYHAVQGKSQEAIKYFEQSLVQLDEGSERTVRTLNNLAIVYKNVGEYALALKVLGNAEDAAIEKSSNDLLGLVYGEYASVYKAMSYFDLSIEYLVKSIKYWSRNSEANKQKIAVEKQKLAGLYLEINKLDEAILYFHQSRSSLAQASAPDAYYLVLLSLANAHFSTKQFDSAQFYLDGAEGILAFNNPLWNTFFWDSKARLYAELGDWPNAKKYYQQAYDEAKQNQLGRAVSTLTFFIGYAKQYQDFQTLRGLLRTEVEDTVFNQKHLPSSSLRDQMHLYETLSEVTEFLGDDATALKYARKKSAMADSISTQFNAIRVEEVHARYQTELLRQEQTILQKTVKQEKLKNYIVLGAWISSLLLLVLGWRHYRFWRRNKQLELNRLQQINDLSQKDLEKAQVIAKLKEDLIAEKEQEIYDQTTERIRLQEEINALEKIIKKEKNPRLTSGINRLKINTQSNWKSSIEKYKSMNMGLVANLSNPDLKLTRGDVEFSLLLSMRLQTKEIASILSISPSSVSTKKYRLIKKLKLNSDVDFDQWLQDMNTANGV